MARPAPSEQSSKRARLGKPLSVPASIEPGNADHSLRFTSARPTQYDVTGLTVNDRVGRMPKRMGTAVDVRDVKFRIKHRDVTINEPNPTRRSAEMPAYRALREVLLDPTTVYSSDIAHAIAGQEPYAQRAFEALLQDKAIPKNELVDARKEMIQRFLRMPLTEQLQIQIDETKEALTKLTAADRKAGNDKILRDELRSLEARQRREQARPEAESHDRFTASLLDAFDAKRENPDLEEFQGRLSGIQDAVSKLNSDVLGKDRVATLRKRAEAYQARFATEKAAAARQPREAGKAEFDHLEREIAQLGRLVNQEGAFKEPNKLRQRIDDLRRGVLELSNIPGAKENPRYEALLTELNESELALASYEGDELAQLLQEVSEGSDLVQETVDKHAGALPPYRPDALDAAKQRLDRVDARLKEGYDESPARFSPTYQRVHADLAAAQARIRAFRTEAVSPRVEARAQAPSRAERVPSLDELEQLLQQPNASSRTEREESPRVEQKMSHVALIDPEKDLHVQQFEATAQSSDWTQRVLDLETHLKHAHSEDEKRTLEGQLVDAAHKQEVALKREFMLLSAHPLEMAKAVDQAAAMHTRLLADELGRTTVEKIRALEAEGRVFDAEMAGSFKDPDERAIAQRWLVTRQTSNMLEAGIMQLREYHEAEIKLLQFREETLFACESCAIPKAVRDQITRASTHAEKKHLLDEILRDPRKMDHPVGLWEWTRKYGIMAIRALTGGLAFQKTFGSVELTRTINTLEAAENGITSHRQNRADIGFVIPPGPAGVRVLAGGVGERDAIPSPEAQDTSFDTFMEISERAGMLIKDMRAFSGDVTETVITRFASRLRSLEDDMAAYDSAPPSAASVYNLAQAKLTDARQELGKLQQREVKNIPFSEKRNVSPDLPGRIQENVSASREDVQNLQGIEDAAMDLREEVEVALSGDEELSNGDFNRIDREAIILSARLRGLQNHKDLPAYKTADRALSELNNALDRYEANALARDRANKNRPAELIFKAEIENRLREALANSPKRAALSHYLAELNNGLPIRVVNAGDVQTTLLKFLRNYSRLETTQRRQAAQTFSKIYELLNLERLYRDLQVRNLDELAAVVGNGINRHQAAANDNQSLENDDDLIPVEYDLAGDQEEDEDNTTLAA